MWFLGYIVEPFTYQSSAAFLCNLRQISIKINHADNQEARKLFFSNAFVESYRAESKFANDVFS